MYLRWQYVGPSWLVDEGKNPRSRRLIDKRPVLVGEPGLPMCRYRLSVVASRRGAPGRPPRARVVVYLGIVDEAQLHPYVADRTGQGHALTNRNTFVTAAQRKLKAARDDQRLTQEQYLALWAALDRAFPKMSPPPGRSFVVIPARVLAQAERRFMADVEAYESRRQDAVAAQMMGMPLATAQWFMQQAKAAAAKDKAPPDM